MGRVDDPPGDVPHPDNTRAVAACRKIGFGIAGEPRETPWGLILPMKASR